MGGEREGSEDAVRCLFMVDADGWVQVLLDYSNGEIVSGSFGAIEGYPALWELGKDKAFDAIAAAVKEVVGGGDVHVRRAERWEKRMFANNRKMEKTFRKMEDSLGITPSPHVGDLLPAARASDVNVVIAMPPPASVRWFKKNWKQVGGAVVAVGGLAWLIKSGRAREVVDELAEISPKAVKIAKDIMAAVAALVIARDLVNREDVGTPRTVLREYEERRDKEQGNNQ